jgi:hypothetical protein
MRFVMPQSEKFELQGNQDQAPVLGDCGIMFSQRGQFLVRAVLPAENCGEGIDSLPDPLFQQREEDVFLALKIGVEGAARVAGPGSDIFEAGGFETVTGKDSLGGRQQLSPGLFGSLDLPGADARSPRDADSALAFVLRRQ